MKDGAYIINLDEYADIGTHQIGLIFNKNNIVSFDSFSVEHVPEEMKEFIGNKNITGNIFQIEFIDFMLAGKKLTDFSPYDFDNNDDIIFTYFKDE